MKIKTTKKKKHKVRRRQSLSRKLVLSVVIILFLSVTVLGSGGAILLRGNLKQTQETALTSELSNVSFQLQNYLRHYRTIVNILGNESSISTYAIANKSVLHPKDMATDNDYLQITTTLNNLKKEYPDIINIYMALESNNAVITERGNVFKYNNEYDLNSRGWYQKTKELNDTIVYKPYVDVDTEQLVFTISAPISMGNKIIGAVGIDLKGSALKSTIEKYDMEGREILLVDEDLGIIYAEDNNSLVGKPLGGYNSVFSDEVMDKLKTDGYVLEDGNTMVMVRDETTGWYILFHYNYDIVGDSVVVALVIIFGFFVVLVAVTSILLYFIIKVSLKEIPNIEKQINNISQGDLSQEMIVKSKDEIGDIANSINNMTSSLKAVMQRTQFTSNSVNETANMLSASTVESNHASNEVMRAITEITTGMNDQASSVDECASLSEGMGENIEVVYSQNITASDKVNVMTKASEQGLEAVKVLQDTTEDSNAAIGDVEKSVTALQQNSVAIGSILDTITSIAEQTNLLALNASIEAARAGEHGRGFAVVAEEIRGLAEGSANAAKEIGGILGSLQEESKGTVTRMNKVKESATEQNEAVKSVQNSFDQLNDIIADLNDTFMIMTKSMDTVNGDKDRIINAIQSIAAVSQQTAASTEEINASMEEQLASMGEIEEEASKLQQIVTALNDEISKFKL